MRRTIHGSLEADDDPDRVDAEAIFAFLSQHSYWARDRTREEIALTLSSAARVVGLYDGEDLIGFGRAMSDNVHVAYLADVYVLPAYRGRGLGVELVREIVDNGPLSHLRWWLSTADAHGLYARFGFEVPGEAFMTRPGRGRPTASTA